MRRWEHMNARMWERARWIFGMGLDTGERDENEGGEEEGGGRGKRQTDETAIGTTPNDKRKQSRSRSWLPGILVRGATGDDIEAPSLASQVEMEEVPRHGYP